MEELEQKQDKTSQGYGSTFDKRTLHRTQEQLQEGNRQQSHDIQINSK